jgi:hypothetical protein
VPRANLTSIDPVWTTANITRNAFIPLGSYSAFTALRSNLTDRVNGFALFWNLRRT